MDSYFVNSQNSSQQENRINHKAKMLALFRSKRQAVTQVGSPTGQIVAFKISLVHLKARLNRRRHALHQRQLLLLESLNNAHTQEEKDKINHSSIPIELSKVRNKLSAMSFLFVAIKQLDDRLTIALDIAQKNQISADEVKMNIDPDGHPNLDPNKVQNLTELEKNKQNKNFKPLSHNDHQGIRYVHKTLLRTRI